MNNPGGTGGSTGGDACLRQSLGYDIKISLMQCEQLEALEVNNLTSCLSEQVLRQIGTNIKILRIHEDEDYHKRNNRNAVTHAQLVAISRYCTVLTDLKVDIAYDLTWVSDPRLLPLPILTLRCEANGNFRSYRNETELSRTHRNAL